jgi:hypothetical protein
MGARLHIVPISKEVARRFVQDHHRHNEAPSKMQVSYCVGVAVGDELVGVATAGHPVNRSMADGFTLEVNRSCVDGYQKNANSMLYGALRRVAKALGYRRLITYTLHDESGASLRAVGFVIVSDVGVRSWADDSKMRVRHDVNLFGERRQALGAPKYRWELSL